MDASKDEDLIVPMLRDDRIASVQKTVAGSPASLRGGEHGFDFLSASVLGEKLP